MSHPRKHTNKLLEMVDEGLLNEHEVLLMAVGALSDADVHEMCQRNDVFLFPEEDEDDEDEEWDPSPSLASMGLSRDWKK